MAQVASKTCEICNSSPGKLFCIECEQHFCTNCKGLHSRQKATRHHEFQSSSQLKYKVKPNCQEHNEDFIFICIACNVPVCSRCIAETHNGHKVSTISETISTGKEIVKHEIACKLQEENEVLNEIETAIDVFDCRALAVVNEIKEDEKRIRQTIDDVVKQMIDDVNAKTKFEKDTLLIIAEDSKTRIKTLTALEEKRKDFEDEKLNVALFKDVNTFQEKIAEIEIGVLPPLPSIDYKRRKMHKTNVASCFGTYSVRLPPRNISNECELIVTDKGRLSIVDKYTKTVICEQPLPAGIEMQLDNNDIPFFIDHKIKTTTRHFTDLMQKGWEVRLTSKRIPFYINHGTKKTTYTFPRKTKGR
ncbi:E3 ubiquitin-protein ligase TRIM71-like [Mytilus edulis]|uniref:E3 ubiquitin-protein ligase TRIM71-like n=1 Tax=Mytilus edulis TaxID=6550 RepID=UPI0039EDF85E